MARWWESFPLFRVPCPSLQWAASLRPMTPGSRPRAGAALVQVDIGLVREGSFLVRRMAGGLWNRYAPLGEGAAA